MHECNVYNALYYLNTVAHENVKITLPSQNFDSWNLFESASKISLPKHQISQNYRVQTLDFFIMKWERMSTLKKAEVAVKCMCVHVTGWAKATPNNNKTSLILQNLLTKKKNKRKKEQIEI